MVVLRTCMRGGSPRRRRNAGLIGPNPARQRTPVGRFAGRSRRAVGFSGAARSQSGTGRRCRCWPPTCVGSWISKKRRIKVGALVSDVKPRRPSTRSLHVARRMRAEDLLAGGGIGVCPPMYPSRWDDSEERVPTGRYRRWLFPLPGEWPSGAPAQTLMFETEDRVRQWAPSVRAVRYSCQNTAMRH